MATLTGKELMEIKIKETMEFHNFDKWHKLGYKGQGFNYLELEPENDHGKAVIGTFKDYALESKAYLGNMSTHVKGDEVLRCVINYKGDYIPIEEFIKKYNIHIIGASLSSRSDGYPEPLRKYLLSLPVIYIGSAGNDGDDGVTGVFEHMGIMSGAIFIDRNTGKIRRERYSGVEDTMDFATLHGFQEGTSFSQPVLSAMIAVILSKYGMMAQDKIKDVLKSIVIDAGEKGHDEEFGYGVPKLPEDGVITMLENSELYTIDEIVNMLGNYDKTELHIHHTWKPDMNDFNGNNHKELNESMRNYHINTRGFIDIAQHVTQFPDGSFMLGRDFELYPNSSSGYRDNGTPWNQPYVFMIENVGNFDSEEMTKVMRNNLVKLGAYFVGNGGTIYFHNQMDKSKSCPGDNLDYNEYMQEVINMVESNNQPHWAKVHRDNLKAKGITIHEERYNDYITRGEMFALNDRITDDYINRIEDLQRQLDEKQ